MTPTDNEINEAIARWCGFNIQHYSHYIAWYHNKEFYCEISRFKTPEEQLPNFLDPIQGMGLLFKYVVPKLSKMGIQIILSNEGEGYEVELGDTKDEPTIQAQLVFDKAPERALALAVYKLVMEGKLV